MCSSDLQDEAQLREMLAEWPSWKENFDRIESVEIIKLGTAHWPQFSKPAALAEEIRKVADRA